MQLTGLQFSILFIPLMLLASIWLWRKYRSFQSWEKRRRDE